MCIYIYCKCIYIYVDICVYCICRLMCVLYIYMCVHMSLYIYYMCIYIYICITCVYIYVYIYTCMYIYIYLHVCIYICMYDGHIMVMTWMTWGICGNIVMTCHVMTLESSKYYQYCHIFDVKTNWKVVAPWVARCKAKGPATFPFSMNQLMALGRALVR